MALFDFLNDTRRRRGALTPGINPNAPTALPSLTVDPLGEEGIMLPTTAKAPNVPLPRRPSSLGTPPAAPDTVIPEPRINNPIAMPETASSAPMLRPEFNPGISRTDEYIGSRDEARNRKESRLKTGLRGALSGLAQGLASGQGLGAGLGGALGGATGAAIDPRGFREKEWEARERPRILERFALEDAERAQQAQAAKAAADQAYQRMQMQNMQQQIDASRSQQALNERKQAFEEGQPQLMNTPGGTLDTKTRTIIPNTAPLREPKQPTASDAERRFYEATGDTVESQSQKSLAGRLPSIKGRLTAEERRLIDSPSDADDPQAIARAQSKWEKIQSDELNSIRRDTAARVMAQYGGGQRPQTAAPRQAAPRRGSKVAVGQDFINFVMQKMGITDPNEARRIIEEDGYRIGQR